MSKQKLNAIEWPEEVRVDLFEEGTEEAVLDAQNFEADDWASYEEEKAWDSENPPISLTWYVGENPALEIDVEVEMVIDKQGYTLTICPMNDTKVEIDFLDTFTHKNWTVEEAKDFLARARKWDLKTLQAIVYAN